MGFMRHVKACNQHNPTDFIPFIVDDEIVGKVRPDFAETLRPWPDVFHINSSSLKLAVETEDLQERSTLVATILQQLVQQKVLPPLSSELYAAVIGNRHNPVLLLDRAVAPYFGIRSYGQHLNGYVRTDEGMKLWIAKRANDRINYPGCLDNLVAGGLPNGITMQDNLIKECQEEAALPEELLKGLVLTGSVQYNVDTTAGFNPFILVCYDLELPADFQPCCTDGEVQEFFLMPVEEVMEIVRSTDDFKLNCNLVIIDFLIRHCYIGPKTDDYLQILDGLHPKLLV